jgi:hypothetical protein
MIGHTLTIIGCGCQVHGGHKEDIPKGRASYYTCRAFNAPCSVSYITCRCTCTRNDLPHMFCTIFSCSGLHPFVRDAGGAEFPTHASRMTLLREADRAVYALHCFRPILPIQKPTPKKPPLSVLSATTHWVGNGSHATGICQSSGPAQSHSRAALVMEICSFVDLDKV